MSYKLVITKPGFDATSGTVADKNKIFDSDLNHLKTAFSGSTNLTAAASNLSYGTISHNLGYVPLSLSYFKTNQSGNDYLITMSNTTSENRPFNSMSVSAYCDTANVYFMFNNKSGSAGTADVLYEIFFEGE